MIPKIEIGQLTPALVSSHGVVRIDVARQLSPDELVALAMRVGKPQAFGLQKYRPSHFPPEVTLIDSHGDGMTAAPKGFGEGWHQDSTYLPQPPEFTVLHSVEVPESGGDTLFADTRPALLALSSDEVAQLSRVTLVHALRSTYRVAAADAGKTLGELLAELPQTRHPAVMTHPRGFVTLCLSPLYTAENIDRDVRDLFDCVLRKVVKGGVVHRWKAQEVVIWDNRVVLHAATTYPGRQRRCMMRAVVKDIGDML